MTDWLVAPLMAETGLRTRSNSRVGIVSPASHSTHTPEERPRELWEFIAAAAAAALSLRKKGAFPAGRADLDEREKSPGLDAE
jgi:hypothetical protein